MKFLLHTNSRHLLLLTLITVFSAACSFSRYGRDSAPRVRVDTDKVRDAVPRREPRARNGNPPFYKVRGRKYYVLDSSSGYVKRGIASWYGTKFHGRKTSSGEIYDMYKMTAAHTTLPLPTYARVTNLENGRSVIVRINDRGPFHQNRLIDLSYVAAKKLGIVAKGTGLVEVRSVSPAERRKSKKSRTAPPAAEPATTLAQNAIYIQVGAFASQYNAQQLLNELSNVVSPSLLRIALHTDNQLHRVRVGPISDVREADRLADLLSQNGYTNSQIVVE